MWKTPNEIGVRKNYKLLYILQIKKDKNPEWGLMWITPDEVGGKKKVITTPKGLNIKINVLIEYV